MAEPKWITTEFTRDLDCIGPEKLQIRDAKLFDRLRENGFEWVPRGSETPPVACFAWPDKDEAEVEVEFLVPARGDGTRRVVEVQEGITAQALRNIRILTDDPLDLRIDETSSLAADLEFRGSIWLPQLGHFLIQKALIHTQRSRDEQIKDMFYVFDLIDRENGLACRCVDDVASADVKWSKEVDEFIRLLQRRATEAPFMISVSEQYPVEKRPRRAYIEREIHEWLEQLGAKRDIV